MMPNQFCSQKVEPVQPSALCICPYIVKAVVHARCAIVIYLTPAEYFLNGSEYIIKESNLVGMVL